MIYSTLLAFGAFPTTITVVYTVPANTVCVIRDIEYLNFSGASTAISINGVVSGSNVLVLFDSAFATGKSQQWKGRVVLPAGATLEVNAGTTSATYSISGYQLT